MTMDSYAINAESNLSNYAKLCLDLIELRDSGLESEGIVPSKDLDKYEIEREIGFGKYSRVFKGYDENKHPVVLKVLKPTPMKRVIREVRILEDLSEGPNIIKFIEVVAHPTSEAISLVFEYVNNEASKFLYRRFTPNDVKYYMFQILRALEYSMSRRIMHRDIKPNNIMIDHSCRMLRLVDWGLAEYHTPGMSYSVRVASLNFKGPELLLGYREYDYSLDIWCLGCVFAEMIFWKHPFFHGVNPAQQLSGIMSVLGTKGLLDYIKKYDIDIYNLDKSVITIITKLNHAGVSWKELAALSNNRAWESSALDLLDKFLRYDHNERITPTAAMAHPYFDGIRESFS